MVMRRTSILVVEDEVLISDMVADALLEQGFDVHTEMSGEAALRYLETGPEVDVLFTDINLQGLMDGATLAAAARERRPDLPVVYCSGRYSSSAVVLKVTRSVFVSKPYDLHDVCTLLSRMTGTSH
jgi:DNA-binding NtrC family response regulator